MPLARTVSCTARIHRVELVVAGDDLVQRARIRVFLEDDEMLEQVEEALALEHPAHQHLQLQRGLRSGVLAIDRAPDLEPLLVRRHGTHARLQAIAHHQRRVVMQQRGNLRLVGLQLRVGAPDRRVLIGRVLQLDQAQRQPVDENHDVRPPVVLPLDHCELLQRQPVVRTHLAEIRQPHMVTRDAAIQARVFHRHAIAQHPMKCAIGLRQRRRAHAQHLAQSLLPRVLGNGRVQSPDCRAQAPHQHHVAKRSPLRRRFARRKLRAVPDRITQLAEPFKGGVFDDGFVEAHECFSVLRLNKKFLLNQRLRLLAVLCGGLRLNENQAQKSR